ncbi:Catenin-beta-like protein [Nemania sp. NC0429]|nr:Catenin-beta-like protein [Nemania sp. NC0429]
MSSIDELFKASGVGNKRKLEPLRDPNEFHKSARRNGSSSRHDNDPRVDDSTVAAAAEPPPDGDDHTEDDYGPGLPPDDDDDEEGGRFFGSGVTAQEAQVLDYLDGNEAELAPEKRDVAWLRRTAISFEKKISRNAEQRAKFEDDPAKFIASEAELDAEIKALSILSQHPELYPEFARLGCVGSLVGLLAHENTDIAIDAIEIIDELTDEDVDAETAQYDALVDALLEADLLSLLVSNLERLDETQETDRSGTYHALSIVGNLCETTATAERVAGEESLLKWLLRRIQIKEAGEGVSQNRQYAAETLAIILHDSAKNRRRVAGLDAVDIMLQLVAPYRKRDPGKGREEEEYVENLFEALTSMVDEPEGKAKFVEAEGVELCLIMLREGKLSKSASLRLLDHAAGGTTTAGLEVCRKIVEAGGLKTAFTLFMKKNTDRRAAEHLVGIFASMLRVLPADSAERIRLLAKFVEKDYEKTAKLVALRRECAARMAPVDEQFRAEQATKTAEEGGGEGLADRWLLARLDAGLPLLRTLSIVLAWLVAEDSGIRNTVQKLMADRGESTHVIKETIQEQIEGIDADDADGRDTRDMLLTLVQFLE